MPKGHSEASKAAWRRNREYGQLCYLKGLALTLAAVGILPQASAAVITGEIGKVIKEKYKLPGITPE